MTSPSEAESPPRLPSGVLRVRCGPGANCSSAGSAIDVLFYGSVIAGALAVALATAFPPEEPEERNERNERDTESGPLPPQR